MPSFNRTLLELKYQWETVEKTPRPVLQSHLTGIEIVSKGGLCVTGLSLQSHLTGIEMMILTLKEIQILFLQSHLTGIEIDLLFKNVSGSFRLQSHLTGIEIRRKKKAKART